MPTRTDVLQVRLTTDGEGRVSASLATVERRLEGIEAASEEAADGLARMRSVAGEVGAVLGAALGSALTIDQFITANREAARLFTSLDVLTGSARDASAVWRVLDRDLGASVGSTEAVQAFAKLRALGLTPTIEAIRAYANVAAGLGKPLDQFIEAVADAATGEFERLKEFGIKASQENNKVSLTFRGATESIGNNAREIEGYLRKIGETNFAGAVEKQARNLDGSLASVTREFDSLLVALGNLGPNNALTVTATSMADAVRALRREIDSGALFEPLVADFEDARARIQEGMGSLFAIDDVRALVASTRQEVEFFGGVWDGFGVSLSEFIDNSERELVFLADGFHRIGIRFQGDFDDILLAGRATFGALGDITAQVWQRIVIAAQVALDTIKRSYASVLSSIGGALPDLDGFREFGRELREQAAGIAASATGADAARARLAEMGEQAQRNAAAFAAERKALAERTAEALKGSAAAQQAAMDDIGARAAARNAQREELARIRAVQRAQRDLDDRERFARNATGAAGSSASGGAGGQPGGRASRAAAADAERFTNQLRQTISVLDPVQRAIDEYTTRVRVLDQALQQGAVTQERHDDLVRRSAIAYRDQVDVVGRSEQALRDELEQLRVSARDREIASAVQALENDARRVGIQLTEEEIAARRALAAEVFDARRAQAAGDAMTTYAEQAARNIQDAFADFLFDPFDDGVQGMVDNFGKALRRMAAEALAAQLNRYLFGDIGKTGEIGGLVGRVISGVFGGGGSSNAGLGFGSADIVGGGYGFDLSSLHINAKGNAFLAGSVVPFALGGVVDRPMLFPMAGGRTGLMGEAGPEAVMPLTRDAQGRLGVRGGGDVHVTIHVNTPDAASFRASRGQLAAEYAQALRRAGRYL